MGFNFRKSFKLTSGTKLNVGKKNVSASFGGKGFSINTGTRGTFINASIPGTGISYRSKIFKKGRRTKNTVIKNSNNNEDIIEGSIMLGMIVGGILFWLSGSFILSLIPIIFFVSVAIFAEHKESQDNSESKRISSNTPDTIHVKIEAQNHEIISVQQIMDSLYPNTYGLYPHEILALALYPKFKLNDEHYPKYWWASYGVKDVNKLLNSLLSRGFYKRPEFLTIEETLQSYKVVDLQEIIKKHKLKSARKKADLIKTLLDNLSKEDIEKIISEHSYDYFVISDLGEKAIQDDEYVLYTHRSRYNEFDVYSLNMHMKGDTQNFRKHIWQIFSEKIKQYLNNNNYGLYRNTRLHMSDFLAEENKFFEAIRTLAEVIYIDLNGITSGAYPGSNTEYFLYDNDFYMSPYSLPSGIIGRLCEYQEKTKIDDEKLSQILTECFSKISLPFHMFTLSECVQITLCEMKNENERVLEIYKQVQKRLQLQYPELKITLSV